MEGLGAWVDWINDRYDVKACDSEVVTGT